MNVICSLNLLLCNESLSRSVKGFAGAEIGIDGAVKRLGQYLDAAKVLF
ncbi:MAG: hypothetical protein A4E44_01605 [Methanosaeta sp. PtaB.Bin018]|nr:MAG: hypothetical protein A4E44_01605 [Methanosaeta sp. PtaB.Bin018]